MQVNWCIYAVRQFSDNSIIYPSTSRHQAVMSTMGPVFSIKNLYFNFVLGGGVNHNLHPRLRKDLPAKYNGEHMNVSV